MQKLKEMEELEESTDVWGLLCEATRQCKEHGRKFGGAENAARGGDAWIHDIREELHFETEGGAPKQLN